MSSEVKAGLIGLGFVGAAFRDLLAGHMELVEYDPKDHSSYPADALAECDFAVVCVDTPMAADGSCDLSNVVEAVKRLPVDRILLKSAVIPGTTLMLAAATGKSICVSPEYISATRNNLPHWGANPSDVPFTVLGGAPETRRFFVEMLLPIYGPSHVFYQCGPTEAELVKYMENAFLATKVTFVNEFYDLAEALGADWHTVREGWLLDPRVNRSHTAVFPADRGFGGACLPKDVQAISRLAEELGVPFDLVDAVLLSNDRRRGDAPRAP